MIKLKHGGYIATFLAGALFATFGSAYADEVEQFVLTKIKYPVQVNGKEYKDESLPTLNYNGNTYVPLKAIGELTGTKVQWNEKLGQVEIGENISFISDNGQIKYQFFNLYTYISINSKSYNNAYHRIYKDDSGKLYIDANDLSLIATILSIYNDEYIILPSSNPYGYEYATPKNEFDYLKIEKLNKNTDISYNEYTLINPKNSFEIKLSNKKGDIKGFIEQNGYSSPESKYLISIDDVLNKFGFKLTSKMNDEKTVVNFSVSKP
ncbi:copper amine oxidase N-terminal domain-containing protein [Paenibacillus alginolyticus]|uniref:stalk domain-containing protein n=1 Tax=Paenibacillus alginolyticus TaxID=59839 RepID=UPI0003F58AA6|nr:stalk domain-containing protein [Paenibacillus alginolyticus]MCY9667988.1 copper amine oxidase N-terminal domain-containing protein [Paenibacillus alginolyticus]